MSTPPPTAPTSPRPRRLSAPSWLDLRLVLGVLLILGSVLVGARVVSSARDTYPRVAVRRDLAAGTVLSASDLESLQVQLPGGDSGVYLTQLKDALGKRLDRPVAAGELVPAAALASTGAQTTVTVPLAEGSAPQLRKGQRIELWVSTPLCQSEILLPDVTVQAVRNGNGDSFGSASEGQDVVISVVPDQAERVVSALAVRDVQLRAGVLSGPAASGPPVLPDLSTCGDTGK